MAEQNPKHKNNIDRASQIRRDDDVIKDLNLGLYQIDETIKYYFDEIVKLQVTDSSGILTKVPTVYSTPENWKSLQKSELRRDSRGRIQLPALSYKRDSIEKDRNLGNKVDPNQPLYHAVDMGYNKRNRYDNFAALNGQLQNRKASKVLQKIVVPDYVTVTYSCIVFTEFLTQMNSIIEALSYAEGSYWGDRNKFLVRAKIDSFPSVVELAIGEDRVVKSEFTITINGHIIPKNIQQQNAQGSTKGFTKATLELGETVITDINQVSNRPISDRPVGRAGRLN